MSKTIVRPIRVNLRDVWRTEDKDFTPWVAENIEYLNDLLDLNLQVEETEYKAGSFGIDILATGAQGNVIIENQFGKSDHDHLGKILTYLTIVDGSIAIWICEDPRQEHVAVINELNKAMSQRFYMLGIKAYEVGDSTIAPMFNIIAAPSEIEGIVIELKVREKLRRKFWSRLLDKMEEETDLFSGRSPTTYSGLRAGGGMAGTCYIMIILKKGAKVGFYLDSRDKEKNKRIFDILYSKKTEIEEAFKDILDWRRMDDNKSSRIEYVVDEHVGWEDEGEILDQLQDEMIDAAIRLERAFRPQIARARNL